MTVILAGIIDLVIGDPQSKFHPVSLMGRLIALLERIFYCRKHSPARQFICGAVVSLITLFSVYSIVYVFMLGVTLLHNVYIRDIAEASILACMICPRSLSKAAEEIRTCLLLGHLEEARKKIGWIVGRDTDSLEEQEIVRAAVETVAENTVDGILSPLFFFAIGGAPLAAVYRAANTLDSMIGYKNDRYLYFGRFAARLDDIANFIPARISVILFTAAAFLMGYRWKECLRIVKRDAAKHPSPNGGYAEASVAGALGIRLGGYNSYFGKMSFRAYMGDACYEHGAAHIKQTLNLMYIVTILSMLLTAWICW